MPLKRVGVEMAFLPMDAGKALADACPAAELKDALFVLERLRAVSRRRNWPSSRRPPNS